MADLRSGLDDGPPLPKESAAAVFVNIKLAIMQGGKCVAVACSKTMAKRIARALNAHKPNSEGV